MPMKKKRIKEYIKEFMALSLKQKIVFVLILLGSFIVFVVLIILAGLGIIGFIHKWLERAYWAWNFL